MILVIKDNKLWVVEDTVVIEEPYELLESNIKYLEIDDPWQVLEKIMFERKKQM